jgi:hypothetical protein
VCRLLADKALHFGGKLIALLFGQGFKACAHRVNKVLLA